MKKVLLFLTFILFCFPWGAKAQTQAQATLTVHDGTTLNQQVPVNFLFWMYYTRSQFVIPATELTELEGNPITSITFYTTTNYVPYTSSTSAEVYVKEVNYTNITDFESNSGATTVYYDVITIDHFGRMTIEFNNSYVYQGGNLLIGIENISKDVQKMIYFYGENVSWTSAVAGHDNSSLESVTVSYQSNFLPKTTFTYTPLCHKPTGLSATLDSYNGTIATLSWTARNNVTSWDIYYKKASDADYTEILNVTQNSYTLSDLEPNTQYQYHVVANCSGSEMSDASSDFSFTTGCGVLSLPQTFDFDSSYDHGTLPECWTGGGEAFVVREGWWYGVANSGSRALGFACNLPTFDRYSIVALPKIEVPSTGLRVNFWVHPYGNSGWTALEVGYITDDDFSTWNWVASIYYNEWNGISYYKYKEKTVDLPNIPANGRIVFRSTSKDYYNYHSWVVDDITITAIPCKEPTDLQEDAVSVHAATLSWTNGAEGQSVWQIAYSTDANFDPDTVSNPVDVTSNPATINGLTGHTQYYAYVRANCDIVGYSDWVGPVSFTTLVDCPAPTALAANSITMHTADLNWTDPNATPDSYNVRYRKAARSDTLLADDFEDGTSFQNTWDVVNLGDAANSPHRDRYNGYNSTWAWCFNSFYTASTYEEHLINKNELTGLTNGVIEFYYKSSSSHTETFKVGYSSTNKEISSFTFGENHEATTSWQLFHEEIPAGTKYISIQYSSYNSLELYLDDIYIGNFSFGEWVNGTANESPKHLAGLAAETRYEAQVQSNCGPEELGQWTAPYFFTTVAGNLPPTDLAVSDITPSLATASWTGIATNEHHQSYELYISTESTVPTAPSVTGVTESSYTFTGLAYSTQYYVWVRDYCGDDGYSSWTGPVDFVTLPSCPAPKLTAEGITNVTAHTADVAWTGYTENDGGYVVRYRTAAQPGTVYLSEDFEGGSMPEGWSQTSNYWSVGSGTGHSDYTGSANGNYNATCYIFPANSRSDILITPAMNLSSASNATLSFNFRNKAWGNDLNMFNVYYRVDNGEWQSLYENSVEQSSWTITPITVELTGLADHYQIGFKCTTGSGNTNFGYGIGVDDILVYAMDDPGPWQTVTTNPTTTSTQLTGLDAETDYEVQMFGVCGSETEEVGSDTVVFTTLEVCPTPTAFTLDAVTSNEAIFSWTAGGTETAWQLYISTTNIAPDDDIAATAQGLYAASENPFFLINGLDSGTEYYVWVRANCGTTDGYSTWVGPVSFTTLEACDTPTAFTLGEVTAHQASFSWTAGVGNESWDVYVKKHIQTDYTTDPNATVSTATVTINELDDNTTYDVKIVPTCGDNKAYEIEEAFTTPVACPTPGDGGVGTVTQTTADIYWNGESDSYNVRYRTAAVGTQIEAGNWVTIYNVTPDDDDPFTTTLNGLSAGTNYEAQVQADCSDDVDEVLSEWSNSYEFTTLPPYIVTVEVNPSNAGITVTGTGEYTNGQTAHIAPENAVGYHIVNWTDANDSELGTGDYIDINVVSDTTIIANFDTNSYALTIYYLYPDSSEASETYTGSVKYTQEYTVNSPVIPCYAADKLTVTGTMGTEAVKDTVRYTSLATTGVDEQVVCDSLRWIDGVLYTQSTNDPTYTIVGGNAAGCDSVVTLHLQVEFCDPTCGQPIMDVDNISYPTAPMGNLCWMTANLRTTHYANGTPIPFAIVYSNPYNPNNTADVETYGRLYNWASASATATKAASTTNATALQGICPDGWRLPTQAEFEALNQQYSEMQLRSADNWVVNPGNNQSGFNKQPGGFYNAVKGRCEGLGTSAHFYTADFQPSGLIYQHTEYYCYTPFYDVTNNPSDGRSIRCVRNLQQ